MTRPLTFTAATLSMWLGFCLGPLESQTMPDPALTPGAVASTDVAEVCGYVGGLSYSKRHRVWTDKASTLRKYGIPLSDARLYEDDDRVPVCLGGDNADPRNHWPQPWPEAHVKDKQLEWTTCRAVCRDHTMTLPDAQAIFLGDWRSHLR